MNKPQKHRRPQHEAWHRVPKGSYRHPSGGWIVPCRRQPSPSGRDVRIRVQYHEHPDLRSLARALVALAEAENKKK